MTIQITWSDAALTLLVIMVAVLVVYIVKALKNVNKTLEKVNVILDDNKNNINDFVKNLPEITTNINKITKSIKGKTDILTTDENDASSSGLDIESLITSATSLIEIISALKDWLGKKKKRPGLRRN